MTVIKVQRNSSSVIGSTLHATCMGLSALTARIRLLSDVRVYVTTMKLLHCDGRKPEMTQGWVSV